MPVLLNRIALKEEDEPKRSGGEYDNNYEGP